MAISDPSCGIIFRTNFRESVIRCRVWGFPTCCASWNRWIETDNPALYSNRLLVFSLLSDQPEIPRSRTTLSSSSLVRLQGKLSPDSPFFFFFKHWTGERLVFLHSSFARSFSSSLSFFSSPFYLYVTILHLSSLLSFFLGFILFYASYFIFRVSFRGLFEFSVFQSLFFNCRRVKRWCSWKKLL